jgi:hypothetical protein|tara:strand:- start:1411 stop:1581 length:171 start_codon:yes stop_codon:yes gene_type:complete
MKELVESFTEQQLDDLKFTDLQELYKKSLLRIKELEEQKTCKQKHLEHKNQYQDQI